MNLHTPKGRIRHFAITVLVVYAAAIHAAAGVTLMRTTFIRNQLAFFKQKPKITEANCVAIDDESYYEILLEKFPEKQQGYGPDTLNQESANDYPMTYGYVLASELKRYSWQPTSEGKRRIQNSVKWLIDNIDLNQDGKPGWGLPEPFDAWGDGTVNPRHQEYTITTAVCLKSLIDAVTFNDVLSIQDRKHSRQAIEDVATLWCTEYTSTGSTGDYFWYSTAACDNVYCVNVSAMLVGSLSQLLSASANCNWDLADRQKIEETVDACAETIIRSTSMRHNAPFWPYHFLKNGEPSKGQGNDAVHHIYIVWGMELYRELRRPDRLPWTRQQSEESVARFWRHEKQYYWPQDVGSSQKLDRLYGVGLTLAFHSTFGNASKAERVLRCIYRDYRWPDLSEWPQKGGPFLPRPASHALYGMACIYFDKNRHHLSPKHPR